MAGPAQSNVFNWYEAPTAVPLGEFDFTDVEVAAIVANVDRLSADAQLLCAHQRHRSAVSLAILALEEAGKLALSAWRARGLAITPRGRGHVIKQIAGIALFTGSTIRDQTELLATTHPPEERIEQVQAFLQSIDSNGYIDASIKFARGLLDHAKQLGFYEDPGLPAAHMQQNADEELVWPIVIMAKSAVEALHDPALVQRTVGLANVLYGAVRS